MSSQDANAEETEEQGVEKLLDDAVQKLQHGTIKFEDLVKLVAPSAVPPTIPEVLPVPAQITKVQKDALERLSEVYGAVVPLERRELEPKEVTLLVDEHNVLGSIAKMAEERRAGIRTTVLNHNDVATEAAQPEEMIPTIERDKDGHYIIASKIEGEPGTSEVFSCEPRKGTVKLDPAALKALADDPDVDWFSHEDFLKMTEQVRIFSEERAFLLLKKKPNLVRAIREATVTGNASISLNLRKA